ncbi:DUF3086 domain-containing protein [Planktothrix agardhii 1029]|uniref:DUF3086 domain-containing protein n=1 Tax=Planktothrix agardhii TaxID=1160 RepID=UPI001F3E5257|nr:DUF3086 domain-containing protein [Planktothrix agardhii 1029]MCF3622706.1 DUF3086 domain-containing protein [Planktothrix agardhii 1030]CAH2572137.1 hypothetical protein PRNO82_01537 [Planktothrix rubescens]
MNSDETQIRDQNPPVSGVTSSSTSPFNSSVGETGGNSINMNPLPIADPWESNEFHNPEPGSNSATSPSLSERLMSEPIEEVTTQLDQRVKRLQIQEQELQKRIIGLQETNERIQQEQLVLTQSMGKLISSALDQLEQRKQTLQIEIEKLERRRDRIQKEMRTSFAGVSQELAIRVQGFKDYLVGSLQDLVATTEQLELIPENPPEPQIPAQPREVTKVIIPVENPQNTANPQFSEQGFAEQTQRIRQLLDQYRSNPDYYGPPWQLRRTFEPIHAKRVSNWFFNQGGRGALRTMGSRLQNILVASATISILRNIYGNRLRTLVLANSPERLGEWRRGLQDCLGIDRRDFGPEQGIVLFEEAEVLSQKADRLVKEGRLPFIIIDDMEDRISLSLLQFPLWLALAPDPQTQQPPTERF